jgi:hypothetical protein
MKTLSVKLLLLLFLVIKILSSCNTVYEAGPIDESVTQSSIQTDRFHQLFYGEWKLIEALDYGGRKIDKERAEELSNILVGERITFSDNSATDSAGKYSDIEYQCEIVESSDLYIFLGNASFVNETDIINSYMPYFVYMSFPFEVRNEILTPELSTLWYMEGFFIKDAETLVFDAGDCMVEMKRLAYPEYYPGEIGGV